MKPVKFNPIITKYLSYGGLCSLAQSFFFSTYAQFLHERGMNLWQINAINSAFMLFSIVFEMPTGALADRYGRHYSLAMGALVLTGSYLIYYISSSFWLFALAETVGALGLAFANGAADAWLTDSLAHRHEDHLTDDVFRKASLVTQSSRVIGCWISGTLGTMNLALPWLISAISSAIIAVLILFFMKENYPLAPRVEKNIFEELKKTWLKGLGIKQLVSTAIFSSIMSFSLQAINMQWSFIYKIDFHFNPQELGYLIAGGHGMLALGGLASKKISSWLNNEKFVLIYPQLITAFAIIVCSRSDALTVVTGTFLLHEFGRGIFNPVKSIYLKKYVPSGNRATLLSLETTFAKAGSFAGLMVSGYMAQALSIKITWLFSGSFLVLGVIAFMILMNRKATVKA